MNQTKLKYHENNVSSATSLINALETTLKVIDIPPRYTFIQVDFLKEQSFVWLFRYEKVYTRMFGSQTQEHFSFVVDANSFRLKKITYRGEELINHKLPNKKVAYQESVKFLDKVDSYLRKNLEFVCLEPVYVDISLTNKSTKEKSKIPGIKVIFEHTETQKCTWVTLGTKGQIIDFTAEANLAIDN